MTLPIFLCRKNTLSLHSALMKTKRNSTIMDSGEVFYDDKGEENAGSVRGTDTAPPSPYLCFIAWMT